MQFDLVKYLIFYRFVGEKQMYLIQRNKPRLQYFRALGFTSDGNILCKKMVRQWPMFRFLTTFYENTWLMMVITILFLSSVTTLSRTSWSFLKNNKLTKSISTFIIMMIESLWQLLGTAFGHSSFSRSTSLLSNVSNISWLMLSTIMLSGLLISIVAVLYETNP